MMKLRICERLRDIGPAVGYEAADLIEDLVDALQFACDSLETVPPNSGIGPREWLDDVRDQMKQSLAKARGGP